MFRRKTPDSETGATMIEFAIIAPLLAVVAFAGVEFGLLFAQAHNINSVARAAARMASATGATATDDYDILRAVHVGGKSLGEGVVDKVVVFKADSSSGSMDPECLMGSVPGTCNTYAGSALTATSDEVALLETSWPPSARDPGSDYIGIYVSSQHKWITGFFGDSRAVTDTIVMRLEPKTTDSNVVAGNLDNGSVSFSPDAPTASGHSNATSQFDVPGFTPGVVPGFTPGVVPGFTPGVVPGFTPGVVAGYVPGTTDTIPGTTGSTPGVVAGFTPGVDGYVPAPVVTTPPAPAVTTPAAPPAAAAPPVTSPPAPPPVSGTVGSTTVTVTMPPSPPPSPPPPPYHGGF